MAHLIDRDALAAEIKRLKKNNEPKENMQYAQFALDVACGYDMALDDIEAFIDTIEVKEVDLDKEIEKEIETRWYGEYLFTEKFKESAKHFFELGIKAKKGE